MASKQDGGEVGRGPAGQSAFATLQRSSLWPVAMVGRFGWGLGPLTLGPRQGRLPLLNWDSEFSPREAVGREGNRKICAVGMRVNNPSGVPPTGIQAD